MKALDDLTVPEETIRLYAELSGPAPHLVCTFDRSNHFVDVSRASTRILGFDPFELAGRAIRRCRASSTFR